MVKRKHKFTQFNEENYSFDVGIYTTWQKQRTALESLAIEVM